MKDKALKFAKRWAWVKNSWTMYSAAALMAAPDLITFLPTVKDSITPTMYEWIFRGVILLFVVYRVKTQIQVAK